MPFRFTTILALLATTAGATPIDFNRDVRPLLSDNCLACHGFDADARKADLRLDTREGALAVIEPGAPDKSELIHRITTTDPDDLMPPEDSHKKPLTPQQVATLQQWITAGAPWGDHWSFVRPTKKPVPAGTHPVDHFVQQQLATRDLSPAKPAAPHTLARRLAFDLTGLPPAHDQILAFTKHYRTDPQSAVASYIDTLLTSPHFGERMAMWWLDASRYSDTDGYQGDGVRNNWPWRDYVIDAFNANMPFDRFTLEQFAGDLLPGATPEQIIATCFHRNHMTNGEGGRDPAQSRVDYVIDRTNTVGTVFLGLTLGCTQCHDHKFDPVSQDDYYSISAYFNSIDEDGRAGGGAKPYYKYQSPYTGKPIAEYKALAARAQTALDKLRQSRLPGFERWLDTTVAGTRNGFTPWHQVTPTSLATNEGTKLSTVENNTIAAAPSQSDQDDYLITSTANGLKRVTGLRLEVFPHDSHTGAKLSHSPDGEFILTNIKLRVHNPATSLVRDIALSRATADVNGKGRDTKYSSISGTLDDDPRTGWTTRTQPADKPHHAVFEFAAPVTLAPGEHLETVLMHRSLEPRALIGRFRLSLTDQRGQAVRSLNPMPVQQLAGLTGITAGSQVEGELRTTLLDQFLEDDHVYQAALARVREIKRQLGETEKAAKPVNVMVLKNRDKPRATHILERGVWDKHGARVQPGILPAILNVDPDTVPNRTDLARWITSADNPLTARVITNQIWQILFGTGLVRTPADFGLQGENPTHPKLLDWLAVDFVETGWDIQKLIRTIATSATYAQDSSASPGLLELDPDNRLLARGARYRLPSWMLRDAKLAASGLLNPTLGGPPVFPNQPEGIWQDQFMGRFTYRPSLGPAQYRRTIYAFWRRTSTPTFLFDSTTRRTCETTRRLTNTPLQALTLLNDLTALEASRALADTAAATDQPVIHLTRQVLGRSPSPPELATLTHQFTTALDHYTAHSGDARTFTTIGQQPAPDPNIAPKTAAAMLVANLLLNLDEAITHE